MYGDARDTALTLDAASAESLHAATAIARRAYRFDVPDDEGFDPYIVLGLKRNASRSDIRAAYLVFAKELHPDRRANDPEAEKRFKAINYAYHALLLSKKQEMEERWRLSSYPTLMALAAFLIPCACFGLYVLLYLPDSPMQSAQRVIVINASQRIDPRVETTGSLPSASNTASLQTASLEVGPDNPTDYKASDDTAPIIDRDVFLKPQPEETDSLFLSSLQQQQDLLVLHDYLKLDPRGQQAAKVREHLRHLILSSRDRKQLAALIDVVTQDDHIEAALALGRLKKLAEEEINATDTMRWVAAMRAKTKTAYETYLRGYPKGRFSAEARTRLAAISASKAIEDQAVKTTKDNDAWKKARAQNTKASYGAYISAHPNGRFASQANRKLATIDAVSRTSSARPMPTAARPQPRRETRNSTPGPGVDDLLDQRMR